MSRRGLPIAMLALTVVAGCGHLIGTDIFGDDDDDKAAPPAVSTTDGGDGVTTGTGGTFIDSGPVDAAIDVPRPDLQPDASVPPPAPCGHCDSKQCDATGVCKALVFLTHQTYPGAISTTPGTAAVDSVCAKEAELAKLKGRYKAWAAATVTTPDVPWARIVPAKGAYVRGDGNVVLEHFDDMNHGQTALVAPINFSFDDTGTTYGWPNNTEVWTGVAFNDEASEFDCGQWTSKVAGFQGAYGMVGGTGYEWSYFSHGGCDTPRHFYCFQDDDSVRLAPADADQR